MGAFRHGGHRQLPTTTHANTFKMSSGKVKTGALWSKNKTDLAKQLGELKTELGQLRTQKIAGGSASKLTKMCVFREFRSAK